MAQYKSELCSGNADNKHLQKFKQCSPSSQITIADLDKVIHCSKYYGIIQVQKAIKETKKWYNDQEFDDDDFADDWIPNDYDNCDGIDIFMEKIELSTPDQF